MYRKRVMRGGNATTHSSEYYGNDSGSYSTNPPAVGGSAYGQISPVSFGHINPETQTTGPNLHVYPNGGSLIQTGGNGCTGQVEEFKAHGCGYNPNQGGGDGCTGQVEEFEGHGCSYKQVAGCDGCGCRGPMQAVKKRPSQKKRPAQ